MAHLNLLFSAAILAFLVVIDLYTLKYPPEARLFPWVIGIPATLAMLVVTVKEIVRVWKAAPGEALSKQKKIDVRTHALIIAWMAGFLIMIYLLGFYVGAVLFVFLYLKTKGIGWLRSLGLAAGLLMAIYLMFSCGMEMSVYHGLIYSLFLK